MTQFSLSWGAYKQSICSGLCALQQTGEFVDMTLAADGHHVKVHQMVLSLVSPYIKELLASASCPHPVIFLNQVSYSTLRIILEYIYTGEVLIDQDDLCEVVEAAKALSIMGLQDMKMDLTLKDGENSYPTQTESIREQPSSVRRCEQTTDYKLSDNSPLVSDDDVHMQDNTSWTEEDVKPRLRLQGRHKRKDASAQPHASRLQYTTSNRNQLQLILNRYIYSLTYTGKRGGRAVSGGDAVRMWRCCHYRHKKCPAGVKTRGDVVLQRFGVHNHPYHDGRILKRVGNNAVFEAFAAAETAGDQVKRGRRQRQAAGTDCDD